MTNLELELRVLATRGELTYLSLIPVAGKGGVVYHARYTPASGFGHGDGRDADPVNAILAAIADRPAEEKPKRKSREFGDPDVPVADPNADLFE
jgi:hypothetical protein